MGSEEVAAANCHLQLAYGCGLMQSVGGSCQLQQLGTTCSTDTEKHTTSSLCVMFWLP